MQCRGKAREGRGGALGPGWAHDGVCSARVFSSRFWAFACPQGSRSADRLHREIRLSQYQFARTGPAATKRIPRNDGFHDARVRGQAPQTGRATSGPAPRRAGTTPQSPNCRPTAGSVGKTRKIPPKNGTIHKLRIIHKLPCLYMLCMSTICFREVAHVMCGPEGPRSIPEGPFPRWVVRWNRFSRCQKCQKCLQWELPEEAPPAPETAGFFTPDRLVVCAEAGRCAAHRRWLRQLPAACGGAADNDAAGGCVGRGCAQAEPVDLRLVVAGSWGRAAAPGPWHGPAAVAGADCVVPVVAIARTRRSTRPNSRVGLSAPVAACVLFVAAGEAASDLAGLAGMCCTTVLWNNTLYIRICIHTQYVSVYSFVFHTFYL